MSRTVIHLTVSALILVLAIAGLRLHRSRHRVSTLSAAATQDSAVGDREAVRTLRPHLPRSSPEPPPVSAVAENSATAGMHEGGLAYDDSLPFGGNLEALSAACNRLETAAAIQWQARELIAALYERVAGHEADVRAALMGGGLHPYFRAVLLTCLTRGAFPEAADTIWAAALDASEHPEVRRVAVHLLRFLERDIPRPTSFRELIASPDSFTVVAALKVANRHLDREGYLHVKDLVGNGSDLNIRLAATHALGVSPFDDAQTALLGIVTSRYSSCAAPFSEASVIKRTALAHLDPTVDHHLELAQRLALDASEDRGVRRKAILKVAESGTDEAETFVIRFLESLPADEALLIKASVEALLLMGGERGLRAIRAKQATLGDPAIRRMVEHQLDAEEDAI